jgi:hypothetical protein
MSVRHVAGPYSDTWQVRTGHVAAPGDDTCQADLDFLGVRLDQSGGDTCHHWKGDTWHGMTSAAYVSDDMVYDDDDVARLTGQYES